MNLKSILYYTIFLFIAVLDCKAQTKFSEKKVGHEFYMSMPDYMVKTKSLNDNAVLQYKNTVKEAYTLVMCDSKEELAEGGAKYENLSAFHDEIIVSLRSSLKNATETEAKQYTDKETNFYQFELSGLFAKDDGNDLKITYLITYVETKEHFYQILCWSKTPYFKKLLPDFMKIVTSFHE